jgi:hypothetical protein
MLNILRKRVFCEKIKARSFRLNVIVNQFGNDYLLFGKIVFGTRDFFQRKITPSFLKKRGTAADCFKKNYLSELPFVFFVTKLIRWYRLK